jgi:NADPH2:quinone reductase
MKAIRIHRFGQTEEVLQYEEVPLPQPAADELLVRVEAAALNRADLSLRRGAYRVSPSDLPIVPGREFAGTVVEAGASVQGFRPGQRVLAYPGKGGYAEYAVARASWVVPIPDGVDAVTAASVPTVFLTAHFAFLEDGQLKSGESVLVQAASSGVGTAAVQIAKRLGARVFATAGGEEKCRRVRELGADEAIDYTSRDFKSEVLRLTQGRGVDVVLEMIGGEVYQKSLELLAPGGRLVSIGGAFGPVPESPPALSEGRRASRFSITNYMAAHPEQYRQVSEFLQLIGEGKLKAVVDRRFPLAEARAAQRHLEGRDHFGKVVLVMEGSGGR